VTWGMKRNSVRSTGLEFSTGEKSIKA